MPPKPLFKSSRIQTVAVAMLMALFLLGAAGLAKLQAGDGPTYPKTPNNRAYEIPQPEAIGQQHAIVIDTPARWKTVESEAGRFVAIDPEKPTRSITLLTASAGEAATPVLAAQHFFEQHLEDSARETFKSRSEPMVFTLEETGLNGVQFIATSIEKNGVTRQHLLACLSLGGRYFWWVYLTDTVDADGDENEALRANIWLLQSVYRSAKIVKE